MAAVYICRLRIPARAVGYSATGPRIVIWLRESLSVWETARCVADRGKWALVEQARELAGEYRRMRRQGIDPIEARRAQRAQQRLDAARAITFA